MRIAKEKLINPEIGVPGILAQGQCTDEKHRDRKERYDAMLATQQRNRRKQHCDGRVGLYPG